MGRHAISNGRALFRALWAGAVFAVLFASSVAHAQYGAPCPPGYTPAGINNCTAPAQEPGYTVVAYNLGAGCPAPLSPPPNYVPPGTPWTWEGGAPQSACQNPCPNGACYYCPPVLAGYSDYSGTGINGFHCYFCPTGGGNYCNVDVCQTNPTCGGPEMPVWLVAPFLLAAGGIIWLYRRKMKAAR